MTYGDEHEAIKIYARQERLHFILKVSNKGEPIPGVKMGRLFKPFFRGNSSDGNQGLGLGLYIASEIAQAHKGTLSVTSTEKETVFTLSMQGKSSSAVPLKENSECYLPSVVILAVTSFLLISNPLFKGWPL